MLSEKESESIRQQLLEQIEMLPKEQASNLREKIESMSPEELESFVKAQGKQTECFFCQIAQGKVETIKIYEDENVLAILDISPASLGHAIVMPKHHYQFLFQLPEKLLSVLMKVVNFLSEIIINATESNGLNVYLAQGQTAGQRVPHIAFHLIPRKDKDNISFEWARKTIDKKEIEKIAKKMKERISEATIKEEKESLELNKEEKKELQSEAEKLLRHMRIRTP